MVILMLIPILILVLMLMFVGVGVGVGIAIFLFLHLQRRPTMKVAARTLSFVTTLCTTLFRRIEVCK
jgi:MFS superfamily sulfate permease-like transporter